MCPKADDQYDRPLLKGERAMRGEIKSSRHDAFRNIVQEEIKIAMINFASIYPAIWDTEGSVWKDPEMGKVLLQPTSGSFFYEPQGAYGAD